MLRLQRAQTLANLIKCDECGSDHVETQAGTVSRIDYNAENYLTQWPVPRKDVKTGWYYIVCRTCGVTVVE